MKDGELGGLFFWSTSIAVWREPLLSCSVFPSPLTGIELPFEDGGLDAIRVTARCN